MAGLDAAVITRGGGSIAELSCFDSQLIAEAIAESTLPVLSGIGHEINTTVTDLAAHTFAKTPTAVAQLLAGRVHEFLMHMNAKEEELIRLAIDHVRGQQRRMKDASVALRNSMAPIKEAKRRLGQWPVDLKKTIHLHLQNRRAKINNYQKLVEMADPKNTLKRGFTITRAASGKIVRSVKDVKKKETLATTVADGVILSDVR